MMLLPLALILSCFSWAQDKSILTDHDRFKTQNMGISIRELQDGQFNNNLTVRGSTFTVADTTFTVSGGIVSAPSQPKFETDSTNDPSLTSGNWKALIFQTLKYHSSNLYNTTTGTTTIPMGANGDYDVICSGGFAANATGSRVIRIVKNNTTVTAYTRDPTSSASYGTHLQTSDIVPLSVGDTVRCEYFQDTGIGINLDSYPFTKMVVSKRL